MSEHTCHWPGCPRKVPPARWGCKDHWYALPRNLRTRIWQTYRPGQERDKKPSQAYLNAARAVRDWIIENHPEVKAFKSTFQRRLELGPPATPVKGQDFVFHTRNITLEQARAMFPGPPHADQT